MDVTGGTTESPLDAYVSYSMHLIRLPLLAGKSRAPLAIVSGHDQWLMVS
jgi:hypothetical protein